MAILQEKEKLQFFFLQRKKTSIENNKKAARLS
jgi:hypothetical protein